MKKFVFLLILLILPTVAFAAAPVADRPRWSLEMKGGEFIPGIENWSNFFGKRYAAEFGGALGYKIIRQIEVGLEGIYVSDTGQGFAPKHEELAGKVNYQLAPINVFILARGVFSERQSLVPYVGGGWTRMYYREKIEDQDFKRGSTDGYHARAGLQFLLDGIDPSAANSFYLEYGVQHTYLFLEAEYTRAMIDTVGTLTTPSASVNLGGTSWVTGILFEF